MFRTLLLLAFALVAPLAAHAAESDVRPVKVLGGLAELTMPAEFTPMSDEALHAKYQRTGPPKEVWLDASTEVNIALKTVDLPSNITLDALLDGNAAGIAKMAGVDFKGKGKRQINGRDFAYIEFTAKTSEGNFYCYIYFTLKDGQAVMFTVNSTLTKLPAWKPKLEAIVASTKIL